MMPRRWILAMVVVLLLGVAAVAWVRSMPSQVEIGSRAPNFSAVDLVSGRTVTLDDYRGRVTLVNIWATYCVPCQQEIPALDSVYRDLHGRGFRIAAVSVDPTSPQGVRKFAEQRHISFDVLQDRDGKIGASYQTTGVPESFLIDKSGHIVRLVPGPAPWNSPENRRIIEDLLASPAS
jgi:peroxiredoxin